MQSRAKTLLLVCSLALVCGAGRAQDGTALSDQPAVTGGGSAFKVRVTASYPGSTDTRETVSGGGAPSGGSTPTVVIDEFSTPIVSEALTSAPTRVLATLDGAPITDEDVMKELWDRRGRETFDWLVGRGLLRERLRDHHIEIREREIDDRLRVHLDNLRRAFPGIADDNALVRAASGMQLDEYRDRTVWVELALRKIMQVEQRPTEAQLRRFYAELKDDFVKPEQVRISQIFIAPEPGPDSDGIPDTEDWREAERQIMKAETQLRMREDFADVARAYGSGGQLSRWVGRGELFRELEDAAFTMLPGAFTTPIRSSMGYHILKVEERSERKEPTFDEVRSEVLVKYEEARFVSEAGKFMADLKAKALSEGRLAVTGAKDAFPGVERD